MPKPTSPFQAPAASADAFGAAVGGLLKSMSGLSLPPQEFGKLQSDYLKSVTDIWNQTLMATTRPDLSRGRTVRRSMEPARPWPTRLGDAVL